MKILECPSCGTLHAVEQQAEGTWCHCHNPAVHLDSRKHCVGTLTKREVKRATKLSEIGGIPFTEALSWLLEMKSYG